MKAFVHKTKTLGALLALITLLLLPGMGWGQTTIFTETMGTVSATTTIAAHETANGFDNDAFTMSGTADLRATTVSTGYEGASGSANVFFTNTIGRYFLIEGVNTIGYTNLALSIGHYKSTTAGSNELALEVSSDGTNWTVLSYSRPTGAGTASWLLVTPTGTIPATSNLRIKFTQTSATTQFRLDDVKLVGTLAGSPTITVIGTFINFTTLEGTPSASQSVAVSGENLTANIDVSAVAGYEYSTTNDAPWTSTLSLASSFNGNVFVRLIGSSAGTYNGTIAFSSAGASTVNRTVNGTVTSPPPANDNCTGATALTLDATAVTGDVAGATQSIPAITCAEFTGTADDDVWYSFTTVAAGAYTITVVGSASFDAVVDLRSGACNGITIDCADAVVTGGGTETITATLSAATTYYVRVYTYDATVPETTTFTIGVATSISPTISVSTFSLTGFTYVQGSGPSAEQTFTVEGVNLTDNLAVSPSTNYEVSLTPGSGYTTPISLTPSNGAVATTTIYVRLKADLTAGTYNDENIVASSTGATTQNVTCSGNVDVPLPILPIFDNFNYADNALLTANGWTAHSGEGTSPVAVGSSNGLTYAGYSGINGITGVVEGNAAKLFNIGEDVSNIFSSVSSGYIYFSFLVNVTTGTAGYFLHLGGNTSSFAARVFVKSSATTGKINFGISNTSTASYAISPTDFDPNTTYLLIIKYNVSSDGAASIWILPTGVPNTEVDAGTPEHTTTGTGQTTIDRVCLRQYSATQKIEVDGLRVGTSWASIFPAAPPTITSFNPTSVCAGGSANVVITGTNFTGATAVTFNNVNAASYVVDNAGQITAETPAGVSNGKISVTTPGGTVESTSDFTVDPLPSAAGLITGTSPVMQGATGVAYSVDAVANATSYTWAFTGTGATINNGTTNSITIDFASNASSGNLTVKGTNVCGDGAVSPDFSIYVEIPPQIDWCNLEGPANGNIALGENFIVSAKVYEPGVTDATGQGAGIHAWIGYSTTNSDPSTWTNWVIATYDSDQSNDDLYKANIGTDISSVGTYYYASRFQLGSSPYKYGGLNNGFWHLTNNPSGILTVILPTINWCNLQYPATGNIPLGDAFDVYAQVYEPGVTDASGQGAGISAWIGYSSTNTDPAGEGWTWIAAIYNSAYPGTQNDEYRGIIGATITSAGTYYYASRFKMGDAPYVYGGYNGGFWDGTTNISGVLTVNPPPGVYNATLGTWYYTIQSAVDAATINNTILVYPGTYNEAITINKSGLTLQSIGGRDATIIDAGGAAGVVGITILKNLGTVTVDGFTVTNWKTAGIGQSFGNAAETAPHLLNNKVIGTGDPVHGNCIQVTGANSEVTGNLLIGARYTGEGNFGAAGILVYMANNSVIHNNNISDSDLGISVMGGGLYGYPASDGVQVTNNMVVGGIESMEGISVYYDANNVLISGNTITGFEAGVLEGFESGFGPTGTVATGNKIYGNTTYGAQVYTDGTVIPEDHMLDATGNWWGDATGPLNASINPCGTANAVTDRITICNWYTDAAMTQLDGCASLVWTGAVDNDWNNADNWNPTMSPDVCLNVTIPFTGIDNFPTLYEAGACNNINIKSGATLLDKGLLTVAGTATVERYIAAADWGDGSNGWHLLSSPVAAQPIGGAFTPTGTGNGYDFYAFDETVITNYDYWINQKVHPGQFTNFTVGKGYLVAYQQAGTKVFTGALNVSDVAGIPLTHTAAAPLTNIGWNLIGNPYASGLQWGSWATINENINGVVKVLSSEDASYIEIEGGGIIPAMNGFMVEATAATTLTIPTSARTHGGVWNKNTESDPKLTLIAHDLDGQTAQRSNIRILPEATTGYDRLYDSKFLPFYAPQFYSISGDLHLSTNAIPEVTEATVIDFGFIKNNGNNFRIEATGLESISATPYLTDRKTGTVTNLRQTPEYSFTASQGDNVNRFALHFGALGIDGPGTETANIYAYGGVIYLADVAGSSEITVTNLLGQVVQRAKATGSGTTTLNAQALPKGVYVVSVVSNGQTLSRKVVL